MPDQLKNKVPAIRRPSPAAHGLRGVPVRKYVSESAGFNENFPERTLHRFVRVRKGEPHSSSIRRPAQEHRGAFSGCQLADFCPVAARDMQFIIDGVDY